jgi:chromosome segregation ATPase
LGLMIAALEGPQEEAVPQPSPVPTQPPAPTATPSFAPSKAEWEGIKSGLADLSKKTDALQQAYDAKLAALQQNGNDLKSANTDLSQQLALVKNLLDRVQSDLSAAGQRLDQVAQKASERALSDTELRQELSIMHKDLRDNTQDVSILKEEVTKLSDDESTQGQSALDTVLNSKWLAGGALVVGLAALVVSLTRK